MAALNSDPSDYLIISEYKKSFSFVLAEKYVSGSNRILLPHSRESISAISSGVKTMASSISADIFFMCSCFDVLGIGIRDAYSLIMVGLIIVVSVYYEYRIITELRNIRDNK